MFSLSKIDCSFEQCGRIGIFSFSGELTEEHKDDLNMLLMRAIHSIDRAVLNFRKVRLIDMASLTLIKKAYHTSFRLKKPLIITEVPPKYKDELFDDKSTAGGHSGSAGMKHYKRTFNFK